jgi:hypothetical protein
MRKVTSARARGRGNSDGVVLRKQRLYSRVRLQVTQFAAYQVRGCARLFKAMLATEPYCLEERAFGF